jgi:hypothetical protein
VVHGATAVYDPQDGALLSWSGGDGGKGLGNIVKERKDVAPFSWGGVGVGECAEGT